MKAVLDASSGVQAVLPEADTPKAIRLLDEFGQGRHDLIAPDIYPLETLNVLSKAERQNRIPPGSGYALWQTLIADVPTLHPHVPLFPRAYAISTTYKVAIYDCLYVALAEQEKAELITSDVRLATNLQKAFPFIRLLSTFP